MIPLFTFQTIPLIGESLTAWVSTRLSDNSISLDIKRLSIKTLPNHKLDLTPAALKILRIADELNPKALAITFSKKPTSLKDLLNQKPPSFIKDIFRPYIDQRLAIIIELAVKNAIPLHLMNANGVPHDDPLLYLPDAVSTSYFFDYTDDELSYTLRIKINERQATLNQVHTLVLTNKPGYLIHNNRLIKLSNINGNKLRPFLKNNSIGIHKSIQKKYFETFIFHILGQSPVEAKGFTINESTVTPETILLLTIDWQNEPVLIPRFKYQSKEIPADYQSLRLVSMQSNHHPPSFNVEIRDLAHEKAASNLLLKLRLSPKGSSGFVVPLTSGSPTDPSLRLVHFMRKHLNVIQSFPFTIRQQTDQHYSFTPPKLEIRQQKNNDWFDMEIIIQAGDYNIPFCDIRQSIIDGDNKFLLPDGKLFIIPDEWFASSGYALRAMALLGTTKGSTIKLHKMHFLSLAQNRPANKSQQDQPDELIKRFFSHIESLPLDDNTILRQYQKTGAQWLHGLQKEGYGGILADDMGLGKTLQILYILSIAKIKTVKAQYIASPDGTAPSPILASSPRTALIIVSLSLLHNWQNEIRKFTPQLRVYEMTGAKRQNDNDYLNSFDVVLTTYGTLRNDIDLLSNNTFFYLILDESQNIKNPHSQTHKAVRNIRALNRLALTGTPIENSLLDLWAQLSVVNPGLLGSERWFRKHFLIPGDVPGAEEKQLILKQIIKPFILRRTKEAVAPELPPINSQVLYCDPTKEQWSAYEESKSEVRNFLLDQQKNGKNNKTNILILQSLTRLRLIANHPALSMKDYEGDSGKTNEILNRIQQLSDNNNKVLIFSQFVKHLDLIAGEMKKINLSYLMLTGRDSAKTREVNINEFEKNPDISAFLISLKAGSTGLNLTAADYVFLLDPWWNPAAEEQAISRAHRIGQTKPVFVYRFITTGTLEEKIQSLQKEKQQTADLFVNENALNLMNMEGILELLNTVTPDQASPQ